MSQTPEELYQAGMNAMPSWNDTGPDKAKRYDAAVALITKAAEAGHEEAMRSLADGMADKKAFDWAIRVAQAGDERPLVSALTSGDYPVSRCKKVLAAAKSGEPWALTAVAAVYRLGMRDNATDELVATRKLAWGWLPGVPDPDAEGLAWLRRAEDLGWASAAFSIAGSPEDVTAAEALEHLRIALRPGGVLPPSLRAAAGRLQAQLLDHTKAPMAERIAAFTVLADGGDSEAQAWLGDRYRLGDGVAQDYARARELYEKAVAVGEVAALRELGRMCEEGLGGPVDDDRARELYESAAEMGADDFARGRLATKYGLTWYAKKSPRRSRPKGKR